MQRDITALTGSQRETARAIREASGRREEAQLSAEAQATAHSVTDVKRELAATKAAREKLEAAESELAELQKLQDRLGRESERLETAIGFAQGMVRHHAAAVLASAPETLALIQKYKAAQAETIRLARTLHHLPHGAIPVEHRFWEAIPSGLCATPDPAWVSALAGLLTDPQTQLPGDPHD